MDKENIKNGYAYSKKWFEFVDENPNKIKPTHGILWHYLIELNNKLGWKETFGAPTDNTMRMIGVKNYKTYKNTLDDLINWGFVQLVTKSKNQNTSNIIALVKNTRADTKADGKKYQSGYQSDDLGSGKKDQSTVGIDKQEENIFTNKKNFLNEKVDSFFSSFLEQEESNNRTVTEGRRNTLIENLTSIAETDEDKIAVIKQAIAGNHPDFRPLPKNRKRSGITDSGIVSNDYIKTDPPLPLPERPKLPTEVPPSRQEVINFFDANGYTAKAALRAWETFDSKRWTDKQGNSMIKQWPTMVEIYYFNKDENKKH